MDTSFVLSLRQGTLESRLKTIKDHIGVSLHDVEPLLETSKLSKGKLIELAQIIYLGASDTMDDLSAAQVINAGTLGTFLFQQVSAEQAYNKVYSAVYMRFSRQAKELSKKLNEEINPFMVLRNEALTRLSVPYLDRIIAAKTAWGDSLNYSQADLKKAVRISLIGQNEMFCMGIATWRFTFGTNGKHEDNGIALNMPVTQNKEWYKNAVWPILHSTYHLQHTLPTTGRFYSNAISKVYREHFGYSRKVEDRSIFNIETVSPEILNGNPDSLKKAYLAAIFSDHLEVKNEKGRVIGLIRHHKNKGLVRQIAILSENFHFKPSIDSETGAACYDANNLNRMLTHQPDLCVKLGKTQLPHTGYLYNQALAQSLIAAGLGKNE